MRFNWAISKDNKKSVLQDGDCGRLHDCAGQFELWADASQSAKEIEY